MPARVSKDKMMVEIMFVEASLKGCGPLEGESYFEDNKHGELEHN